MLVAREVKHKSQICKWRSPTRQIKMYLMIMVLNSSIITLNWEF